MINMDMIGRIRDDKVYIGGAGTGTTFETILKSAATRHPFHTDFSEQGGYGASDHTSFTAKQVPVLFFFSGLHSDYHKPSDTWDKIDAPQAVKLLTFIGDVIDQLEDGPGRPQLVRVAKPHGTGEGDGEVGGVGHKAFPICSIITFSRVNYRVLSIHSLTRWRCGTPGWTFGRRRCPCLITDSDNARAVWRSHAVSTHRTRRPGTDSGGASWRCRTRACR